MDSHNHRLGFTLSATSGTGSAEITVTASGCRRLGGQGPRHGSGNPYRNSFGLCNRNGTAERYDNRAYHRNHS